MDSSIHTNGVDKEILPTETLYSNSRDTLLSGYTIRRLQPHGSGLIWIKLWPAVPVEPDVFGSFNVTMLQPTLKYTHIQIQRVILNTLSFF